MIANSTLPCPFFALSSSISSIEEDGTIIGGCVYDMNLYCEEIVKMINAKNGQGNVELAITL